MKMTCPHLSESYILSCKADLGVYVPSLFELNQFCQSDRHTVCPYYSLVDNGPPEKNANALPCDCMN
jgi:hypothetical protein